MTVSAPPVLDASYTATDWPILRNSAVPLRLRKKIARFYPSLPKGAEFDARVFGQMYRGQLGIHMDDKVFMFGSHEPATIRLMRGLLRYQKSLGQVPVYLDIGTNTGQHLIAVAPCAAAAYGFEPYEPVRNRALANVAANGMDHVRVFDCGLSDQDAELPFTPPEGNNLGVGTFLSTSGVPSKMILSVRQGDRFLADHGIIPTTIKIDTEGFEKPVLVGLKDTLRVHRPAVVFEYSTATRSDLGRIETLDALFGEDYRYFGIARSREFPKLVPFDPSCKYENVLALPYPVVPDLDFS